MLSHKRWTGEAFMRLCLGVFATWAFGTIIATLVVKFPMGMTESVRNTLAIIVSLLFMHVGSLIWVAFFLRENHLTWREGFGYGRPGTATAIVIGLLCGMLVWPIAGELIVVSDWLMTHLHMKPVAQTIIQELQKPDVSTVQRIVVGIIAIVGAPVVEETLFRGLIYPTIKQAGLPRFAFFGTSILFAAFHLNQMVFLPLVFFAFVLTLLYEATDNLLAPIAAHSMFNFVNFLLLMFQDQVNTPLPPPVQ
jgi:membrane protease YdiL (CAAX protease family)